MRRVLTAAATIAVLTTSTIASASAAHAATGCRVAYKVTNQWQGGFGASVDVTNLGDALTTWRLTWSYPAGQKVTTLWNGVVSQSGTQVTVTNAGWNGSVAAGGAVSIGLNGSFTGGNPAPTDFTLNGVACDGGTTTTPVLTKVSTVSRLKENQFTWPGTYFEGRFRGTAVGLVLNDSNNDYVVGVDGATVATLVTPGQTTYWVRNLADGDHTVRLAKRTESPYAAGEFGGLVGDVLAKPALRTRQMEFIGDSWTAGYGDMSTTHDCNSNGGVTRNSNADVSFGALTAKGFNADYQINAWSGMGMVRNYNGQGTDNFRTYYDTDLQAVYNSAPWTVPSTWRPQVVVIGLGINDFSTALNAGERWTTIDQLAADYRTAYQAFLDKLRARYGSSTYIVLTYPDLSYQTTAFADSVQQIVAEREDARISALYYDNNALGMDLLGCDWHPSQHDHQILANALTKHLGTLPLAW
jgi:lysophospholipase L1-like esterase